MTTNSPPRRSGRVLAVVASVILLVVGASLAVGGAVLVAVFGTNGDVVTDKHPVVTPTAAVVTDIAAIRDTTELSDLLGTPVTTLAADGGNASGLFVGIGPAAEVDAYLSGVEVDQAVDLELDPYSLNLSRREGTTTSADPPRQQDFWVASGTGFSGLDLTWPIEDGDYRVVVMNMDGAAGVESRLSFGLAVGGLFGLALGMLIGGGVLILVAVALLVLTRPGRTPAPTGGGGPSVGAGPMPPEERPTRIRSQ